MVQHHDAITGTHAAHVGIDYLVNLATAFDKSGKLYVDYVTRSIENNLGLKFGDKKFKMCADK